MDQETERNTGLAQFGRAPFQGFRKVSSYLLLILVFLLMSMPLFTTFNEILTKLAEKSGAYSYLTQNVVPFQTRAVSIILKPLGIDAKPSNKYLYIQKEGEKQITIFLSWNCLGWQSGIILILTLIVGLSSKAHTMSKLETIILGVTGTFLINLIRISVVTLIAYYFGQMPATIVHDYFGTLFTIIWFFVFWYISYNYILDLK